MTGHSQAEFWSIFGESVNDHEAIGLDGFCDESCVAGPISTVNEKVRYHTIMLDMPTAAGPPITDVGGRAVDLTGITGIPLYPAESLLQRIHHGHAASAKFHERNGESMICHELVGSDENDCF